VVSALAAVWGLLPSRVAVIRLIRYAWPSDQNSGLVAKRRTSPRGLMVTGKAFLTPSVGKEEFDWAVVQFETEPLSSMAPSP
jgi:hypothetical protein